MKVLYCNPIFLDYRLPFYKRLNELFEDEFYVMYSPLRYKTRFDALLERIPKVLANHAIEYNGEKLFDVRTKSFKKYTIGGSHIPVQTGFLKAIGKVKPDVLITEGFFQWTPLVILYSLLHHVPVFMGYERTCWTERNVSWVHKLHRKLTDWFIKGYLVNGSETNKYLMSLGVKEEKIHIGGMSADSEGLRTGIEEFKQVSEFLSFKERFKKTDGLIYLFTGFLIERKGILPLLAAWKEHIVEHPDDSLVVVGNGDLYDQCLKEYGDLKSVYFEGRMPYTEIHKYYAIADVYVLPTIEDNWSLVIPEAMACGLPVATSIYNGCYPELVHEGENGYVFDTFKKETIVKALDYFHHVDLKAFGQRSIELEKEFNTENSAKRTFDALMSVKK